MFIYQLAISLLEVVEEAVAGGSVPEAVGRTQGAKVAQDKMASRPLVAVEVEVAAREHIWEDLAALPDRLAPRLRVEPT
jgi:hypothetical protein